MIINNMRSGHKKGFTLIETLVSLGIFSIVVVTATGVILSIITASKRNQSINTVVNNLNYSVDSMVRDINTGYRYRCDYESGGGSYLVENFKLTPSTCSTASNKDNITLISTITGVEQVVKYKFIVPTEGPGYIEKTVYAESGGNAIPTKYALTDIKNIDITKLAFTVTNPPTLISGEVAGQPSVFVVIKGTAKINQINISDFFIQMFISQRLPNLI